MVGSARAASTLGDRGGGRGWPGAAYAPLRRGGGQVRRADDPTRGRARPRRRRECAAMTRTLETGATMALA